MRRLAREGPALPVEEEEDRSRILQMLDLAKIRGSEADTSFLGARLHFPKGPRTQIIGSLQRGYKGMYGDVRALYRGI